MKTFLTTSLIIVGLQAQASTLRQIEDSVVKLISTSCLLENPRLEGSGTLIKLDGAVYVLTSEHVLIHDRSKKTCHSVDGEPAQLVSADVVSGLALLKLKDASALSFQRALDFNQVLTQKNDVGTIATALGVPAGTRQIQVLQNGRIQSNRNDRALIPGIKAMIEVSGVASEYGMSGGLLVTSDQSADWKISGVLSHQVLKRMAGKASAAVVIRPNQTDANDVTLVIPASDAAKWIVEKATAAPEAPTWIRDQDLQIQGVDALRMGSVRLKLQSENAQDIWKSVEVQRGGADGTGIGGASQNKKDEEIAVLVVEFAPGVSGVEKGKSFADPMMESWRQELLKGKKVQIVFLKSKTTNQLTAISSVSQFLTQWLRDGNRPLALVTKDLDASPEQRLLFSSSLEVARMAQDLKNKSSDPKMVGWFELIRNRAVGVQALTVSSADMAKLLTGPHKEVWESLYREDFDSAVAFEGSIQKLVTDMQKLGM